MPQAGWHDIFQWWLKHWTWLFWTLVLLVVVQQAVRWLRIRAAGSKSLPDGPEEILRLRYACGEIDRSEYKRRLDGLRVYEGVYEYKRRPVNAVKDNMLAKWM